MTRRPLDERTGPPPRPPVGGPPPSTRGVPRDGPARATAATLVAASGALLLAAAAATFLAVSWDSLGVAARVAIVVAATATAITGGAGCGARCPPWARSCSTSARCCCPSTRWGSRSSSTRRLRPPGSPSVAAVPTGVWLAVGGSALVGAAVVIERTGGAPRRPPFAASGRSSPNASIDPSAVHSPGRTEPGAVTGTV